MRWTLDGSRARLSFEKSRVSRALHFAWGPADAGHEMGRWPASAKLASVGPDATSVSVPLPDGFDARRMKGRFFLYDVYDASSYVQDGLVFQLDAVENAGRGVHAVAPAQWKDLAGNRSLPAGGIVFGADSAKMKPSDRRSFKLPCLAGNANKTLEFVGHADDTLPRTMKGRVDFINAGNDCALAFRDDSWPVLAIFAERTGKDGLQPVSYFCDGTRPGGSAKGIRMRQAYSAVQYPDDPSRDTLRVNRELTAEGGVQPRYRDRFRHTDVLTVGLWTGDTHVSSARLYSRALTPEERDFNAAVDAARFLGRAPRYAVSKVVPDAASFPGVAPFRYASWNIGHFSNGKSHRSTILPARGAEMSAKYGKLLDSIAADWFGVCEYSEAFTTTGSMKASAAVFGRYPVKSFGPVNHYQVNGAFAKRRFTVLEKVVKDYHVRTQKTYYIAHRVAIDDACEAWFVQTHQDWQDGSFRTNQIDRIVNDFAGCPRVVVSGDFNSFWRDGLNRFVADWTYANRMQQAGFHVMNTGALGAGVDQIYVRGFAMTDGTYVRHDGLSDHNVAACRLAPLVRRPDGRMPVQIPAGATPAFWTGRPLRPVVTSDPGYRVSWPGNIRDLGTYAGTATLVDPVGTCWIDGTTEPKKLSFSVVRRTNGWLVEPQLTATEWTATKGAGTLKVQPRAISGTPVANFTPQQLAALPPGRHVYRVSVPQSNGYTGLVKEIPITVRAP